MGGSIEKPEDNLKNDTNILELYDFSKSHTCHSSYLLPARFELPGNGYARY